MLCHRALYCLLVAYKSRFSSGCQLTFREKQNLDVSFREIAYVIVIM